MPQLGRIPKAKLLILDTYIPNVSLPRLIESSCHCFIRRPGADSPNYQ